MKNAKICLNKALFNIFFADAIFETKPCLLIVTSARKENFIKVVKRLEEELGKEVSLSVLKLSEWRTMAKKGDAFYKRVVENHILLYGSGLK